MNRARPVGHDDRDQPVVPDAAARYDWECRNVLYRRHQDFEYWRDLARETGGPILELACGTGRLTVPLAASGVEVVGLDHDPAMLYAARRAAADWFRRVARLSAVSGPEQAVGLAAAARDPRWVAADMRHFALARRFALVFVAYNSLQLLTTPGDIVACLREARCHLAPSGFVAAEVTDFQVGGDDGTDAEPMLLADAEGIRMWGTLVHNLADRTSLYRRRFEGDGWTVDSDLMVRSLDGDELASHLAAAGLTPCRITTSGHTIRMVAVPSAAH
ncbi:MAG: class I SAM-dependent methyltransferase [Acidimicrobiales bacterium]